MGIATRIAVRLTPDPPVVRTLLLDFTSIEDAAATVSGIIAAGIVPAALEMMDAEITRAVEDYVGRGLPARRGRGAARRARRARRRGRRTRSTRSSGWACEHGARTVRVAADDAERALLWKGRKSAFGAIARIAPDYYLHDAVVPRTKLVDVLRQVYAIAHEQRLTMMNVFHAGDGNLHPLIVFDAREPGVWERVHRAGDEILAACVAAGGVLSGEHGIGLGEARSHAAGVQRRRPRRPGAAPRRVRPVGSGQPAARCCRAAAGAASSSASPRARGSDAHAHRGRRALRDGGPRPRTVAAVGSRTHWEVGGPAPTGDDVTRCTRPPASSPTTRPTSPSPSRPAPAATSWPAVLAAAGQECALDPRDGGCHRRRGAGDGPVRPPPPPSRAAPRPGARGALRHRRRTAREGRRTDGQERQRLRPAPPAGRLARHASACSCRSRCGANPCPRAPSGSSPPPTRSRCDASCTGPRASLWDGSAPTCCSRGSRPTSPPSGPRVGGAEAGTAARAARRAAPRSHLGAALGTARRSRLRSTRSARGGWRRSASAPCTWRPTTRPPWPVPRAAAVDRRRLAAARGRRTRSRRLRRRAAERRS